MGAVNLNIRLTDDVKRVMLDIWRIPVLFIAFSLYKILALLFFMDGFIFSGTFQLGDFDIPLLALFFIACSFVCVFFAIWLRDSHVFSQSWYLFSLAVCMVLGVLLLFFSSNAGMAVEPIRVACLALGVCFTSFGVMGVHIEFGRLLGMMGMMPTLTYGVASAFGVAVGSVVFYAFVPLPARWVVAFFLPVVVTVLLDRSRKAAFPDQSKLYQEHIDGCPGRRAGRALRVFAMVGATGSSVRHSGLFDCRLARIAIRHRRPA